MALCRAMNGAYGTRKCYGAMHCTKVTPGGEIG